MKLLYLASVDFPHVKARTIQIVRIDELPGGKASHQFSVFILPERKTALAREQVMKTIFKRVPFGKLAAHPARTGLPLRPAAGIC